MFQKRQQKVVGGQHYFPAFITTNIFKSIYSCTVSVFNLTAMCLLFYSGNDLTRTRTSHYGNLKADTQRPRACSFSQQVGVYWTWSFFLKPTRTDRLSLSNIKKLLDVSKCKKSYRVYRVYKCSSLLTQHLFTNPSLQILRSGQVCMF